MSSVLTADCVVGGVVGAIRDDGPAPPTARRLAARLHVAPATLYSVFPSLADAYSSARSLLAAELSGAIIDAIVRSDSSRLVDALAEDPNRGVFVTDPSWPIKPNPMLINALERAGLGRFALSDVLALAGSSFTATGQGLTAGGVDAMIGAYREAVQATDSRPSYDFSPDDTSRVLELVDSSIGSEPGIASMIETHQASARLVFDSNEPTWSFRELGRLTGIPVTRLHRYGSRLFHLSATTQHVLGAAGRHIATDGSRPDVAKLVALLLRSGAADTLIELYNESRIRLTSEVPDFDQLVAPTLSPGAVALMAARTAVAGDVDETAALVGDFATATAA